MDPPRIPELRSEIPGKLERWRLYGLPITSDGSNARGDKLSGGVPTLAVVELMDCGVAPPPGESSDLTYGDLRVDEASVRGSLDSWRLSWRKG